MVHFMFHFMFLCIGFDHLTLLATKEFSRMDVMWTQTVYKVLEVRHIGALGH